MSPDILYSSYMRYKAETDAVASWLLNIATGWGFTFAQSLNRGLPRRYGEFGSSLDHDEHHHRLLS